MVTLVTPVGTTHDCAPPVQLKVAVAAAAGPADEQRQPRRRQGPGSADDTYPPEPRSCVHTDLLKARAPENFRPQQCCTPLTPTVIRSADRSNPGRRDSGADHEGRPPNQAERDDDQPVKCAGATTGLGAGLGATVVVVAGGSVVTEGPIVVVVVVGVDE